jgi:polyhydroxyalkanoate synthesis regulator phasin
MSDLTEQEKNKERYETVYNYNIFCTALLELMKMTNSQSVKITTETACSEKLLSRHQKLQSISKKIMDDLKNFDRENESYDLTTMIKSEYNCKELIKKVYKILYQNFDLLEGTDGKSDHKIFKILNPEGKLVTVIPGVELSLVSSTFSEKEEKTFWGYIYVMFIASIKISINANKNSKKMENKEFSDKLKYIIKVLQKRVNSYGLLSDRKFFNPYFGINLSADENMTLEDMFDGTGADNVDMMESLMSNISLDKYIDVDELNKHLQNLDDDTIESTTSAISKLLNVGDNQDVKNNLAMLATEVINDLKVNGINNIFETAKKVSQTIDTKVDRKTMEETGKLMSNMLQNSQEQLGSMMNNGTMTKEQSDLINKLSGPLQFMKSFLPNQNNK